MDAEEGDGEADEAGDGVGGVLGVEALEEDEGGDDSGGGKEDEVKWVDTIFIGGN